MDARQVQSDHRKKKQTMFSIDLGALPLSPLHVKALADTEERVEQGHIQSVYEKALNSLGDSKKIFFFSSFTESFKCVKPV